MNRERGEVGLVAGDRRLTLRFTTNALCELEAEVGCGITEFGRQLGEALDMRTSRLLVWAALQAEHGAEFASAGAAGAVMDAAGYQASVEAAARALELAFPVGETSEGNGRAPGRSTGAPSGAAGAPPAGPSPSSGG